MPKDNIFNSVFWEEIVRIGFQLPVC